MFPSLPQRLLIAGSALVGSLAIGWAAGPLGGAVGFPGISLLSAEVSPVWATAIALVAMLPAVVLSLVLAWRGNPLAGIFVAAVSLTALACLGGSTDGWLWRAALPGAYGSLIVEAAIWAGLWAAVIALIAVVRKRSGADDALPHHGRLHFGLPDGASLLAGLLCAAIAGTIAWFLVANTHTGQVVGGLIVAFAVAACVSQLLVPKAANPLPMLASPLLVAVVGYAWMLLSYDTDTALLRDWHRLRLPGLALALPIHYASAAMVGLSFGIGWAHGILQGQPTANATYPASS